MEKNTIKISLILFFVILICATFDLALSYNYYLENPTHFIDKEGNTEFVSFLQEGVFPFYNLFRISIMFPILLFILSWFDILRRFINPSEIIVNLVEKIGRYLTITISLFFCFLYIFSGLTWYDSKTFNMNILLSVIENIINKSVGLVLFLLFTITIYVLVTEVRFNINKIQL